MKIDMKRVDQLFNVKYGVNLELNALTECDSSDRNAIPFVSRTSQNNGVSAVVEKIADLEPIPAGTISVAAGGSVMESFLQPRPYYSGRDIFFLTPLKEMSDLQKLYYCLCLRENKFRYNYGRQANSTLGSLEIPDLDEIPEEFISKSLPDYSNISIPISSNNFSLNTSNWQSFEYEHIFNISRGESLYLQDAVSGPYPYISASASNNGVTGYINVFNREGNCIVVNYDGSIAEAFYHDDKFFASEKVVTLTLKNYFLNKYIAFFLITLIRKEKYRFNYGLKWAVEKRMKNSIIKLPVNPEGEPDFPFMEDFIKSQHYSNSI